MPSRGSRYAEMSTETHIHAFLVAKPVMVIEHFNGDALVGLVRLVLPLLCWWGVCQGGRIVVSG